MLAIAGASISGGYSALFDASFGSLYAIGTLLIAAVPLLLVGLGVALPYRAGLFNIGGEGQLLAGAIAAVVIGTRLGSLSGSPISFALPLIGGFAAGALIGSVAGGLKAWRGVNEVVTTIMLNFILLYLVQYLTAGPLHDPTLNYSATPQVLSGYQLDKYGASGVLPLGFIIACVAAVIGWWATEHTRFGWRQRLVGLGSDLASRQGVAVGREQFVALLIGGGLAGIGGAAELLGNQLRLGADFSPGWGFDAVAIALLARGNLLAVIPFALFFAVLTNGASTLEIQLNVSGTLVLVLAGAPVLVVAAILGYRAHKQQIAVAPDD
jgi:simple sugar transport system permease protein